MKKIEWPDLFGEYEPLLPHLVRIKSNDELYKHSFNRLVYMLGFPAHFYNKPIVGKVLKEGDVNEALWCPDNGGGFRFKHEKDADEFAGFAVAFYFAQAGLEYDAATKDA